MVKLAQVYANINIHMLCTYVYQNIILVIIAVCSTGCYNGGNCTAPEVCTCPSEWTGNDCRQGTYVGMNISVIL